MKSDTHGSRPLGRLETAVCSLSQAVFEAPFWLFCAIVIVLVVARNGADIFPALSYELSIALALPDLPSWPVSQQYFFSSLTGPILARLLGISTAASFITLHLVVIVMTAAAAVAVVYRRDGDERARLLILAVACSAIPMVLLGWLGSYDPFTVLAILIASLAESHIVMFFGAMLLGFAHFEQGVFAVTILILLRSHRRFTWFRTPLVLIGGLVLGKAVLVTYLTSRGLGRGRVDYVAIAGLSTFVKLFLRQLPVLIGSWLGAFWVWMTVAGLSLSRRWPEIGRWILALTLAGIASLMALDETRVFALVSLPLVVHVGMDLRNLMSPHTRRSIAVMASCVAIIMPPVFVWEGTVHATGWGKFLHVLRTFM